MVGEGGWGCSLRVKWILIGSLFRCIHDIQVCLLSSCFFLALPMDTVHRIEYGLFIVLAIVFVLRIHGPSLFKQVSGGNQQTNLADTHQHGAGWDGHRLIRFLPLYCHFCCFGYMFQGRKQVLGNTGLILLKFITKVQFGMAMNLLDFCCQGGNFKIWPMLALPFTLTSGQQNPHHWSIYFCFAYLLASCHPSDAHFIHVLATCNTGLILLKFISQVQFGMTTDNLDFDHIVAIFVAIVAISKFDPYLHACLHNYSAILTL